MLFGHRLLYEDLLALAYDDGAVDLVRVNLDTGQIIAVIGIDVRGFHSVDARRNGMGDMDGVDRFF